MTMSDEMILSFVCAGLLAVMCLFSVQRRCVSQKLRCYGSMYQSAPRQKDERRAEDGDATSPADARLHRS